MTSLPPPYAPKHGAALNRFITPSARILMAAVIVLTGAGISAVFFRMPGTADAYDLCDRAIVDKDLAAVPLPSEAVAAISESEIQQLALPMLDQSPVRDDGGGKYAQVYAAPAALKAEQAKQGALTAEEESAFTPVISQKFEPARQIVSAKPISVENVNRDFLPKPATVDVAERSDELQTIFHFAENSRHELESPSQSNQPANPFPVLQPLEPITPSGLLPLLPLKDSDLKPLSALNP
jgi:hypothetical protein